MKLKQLHYKACPVCGARVVSEAQRSQHCNGEWFETVSFECECRIAWVPNFSREQVERKCPEHPEEKGKIAKQEVAMDKLKRYVKRLDVDEGYKEYLMRYW